MIRVLSDAEAVSEAAAELFASKAREAVDERGRFSVALSGGSTPRRTYERLASPPLRTHVPWADVHVFWGDERCVPPDDPRSNEGMAREALLDRVHVPPGQVHPMRCEGSPHESAARYEKVLREFFEDGPPKLDLVLLGLGENGHTASLFPGTPVLDERTRWVAEVWVEEDKLWRLTLTAPVINEARTIAFIVCGATKAQVLREVLEGPRDARRLPAQLIRPTEGELHWLVDEAAAERLTSVWP